jgi:hypothetical protein
LCGYGSIYWNCKLNEVSSNCANFVLWKDFIMFTYFSYLHFCWNGTYKIKSFVLTLYTCTLFCILDTEHLADTARYIWQHRTLDSTAHLRSYCTYCLYRIVNFTKKNTAVVSQYRISALSFVLRTRNLINTMFIILPCLYYVTGNASPEVSRNETYSIIFALNSD